MRSSSDDDERRRPRPAVVQRGRPFVPPSRIIADPTVERADAGPSTAAYDASVSHRAPLHSASGGLEDTFSVKLAGGSAVGTFSVKWTGGTNSGSSCLKGQIRRQMARRKRRGDVQRQVARRAHSTSSGLAWARLSWRRPVPPAARAECNSSRARCGSACSLCLGPFVCPGDGPFLQQPATSATRVALVAGLPVHSAWAHLSVLATACSSSSPRRVQLESRCLFTLPGPVCLSSRRPVPPTARDECN